MSTNKGAIIFFNVWDPHFIEVALKTARANCPDCRVIHLHCDSSGVGWDDSHNIDSVLKQAWDSLSGCRQEIFGPNCTDFQKVCIARWKVIGDWMESNGIEEACCCDADVLMFQDPFTTPHYQPGRLHLSDNHTSCCHAGNSIVSLGHIRMTWDAVMGIVGDPKTVDNTFQDMAAWMVVVKDVEVRDQNQIIDGLAWDHHMGCVGDAGGGWEEDPSFPGYKRIQWIEQKPHCLHVPSGKLIRLVNLHCWGDAEFRMSDYARLGGVEI